MHPGYVVRIEAEGAVSVVAAVQEVPGEDEADSVGPAKQGKRDCSDAESAREVGVNHGQRPA